MNNIDSISLAISSLSRLPDLSLSYLWEQDDQHQTVTEKLKHQKVKTPLIYCLSDLMRNISYTLNAQLSFSAGVALLIEYSAVAHSLKSI